MYSVTGRVGASETGPDGLLTLVGAINKMQDTSMFWLESEPEFSDFLNKNNLHMLITYRQTDILNLPKYGEEIRIATGIFDCKGYFGYRNTTIYNSQNKPCVLSWSVGVFVDSNTGKLTRLTDAILDNVFLESRTEMEYTDKKIKIPKSAGKSLTPIPVRKSQIDINKHVNNAKYIETAYDLLPQNFLVSRVRVEYKTPAKYGNTLHPRIITENNKAIIILASKSGHPYSIVEFTGIIPEVVSK